MNATISARPTLQPIPTAWEVPVANFETQLRARGLREASVDTRVRHLRRLARDLDGVAPLDVDAEALIAWAGRQTWAPETRHSYYQSVREFFALLRPGDSPANSLPAIHRQTPAPRPTPELVFEAALARADERCTAILTLAGRVGLRRSEIAQVNGKDLVEDLLGYSLTVTGKGGKTRQIPLTDEVAALIRTRAATNPDGWVFPSRDGGHISSRWLAKLASQVLPPQWTLHTLRHRFATRAYAGERDIIAVQRLLGHNSIATTQRYTAPPDDALRRAVEAAA
ncbi:tyrosine-type recombinase/integrase [Actinomyces radicidentis]|uniref:tyrosine-type recombinase/integrase n=1 Tax=Actinomyces radicidentis TaxID=111015 RepID=UPI0028E55FC0|nr:tyrosine-type recombinase/integrase [Actinomyces radicidentis]